MMRKIAPLLLPTFKATQCNLLHCARNIATGVANRVDVYEPDYLDSLKPKYPQYESLNVQIKGYDYPVLESYQRYLHSIAEYLDIDVADCYALPPQNATVQRFKPHSAVTDSEYRLQTFERNLHLLDVNAPVYPMFLRIAQAGLPEGVELSIVEHNEECDERRYVPDRDLKDLKAELEKMQIKKK